MRRGWPGYRVYIYKAIARTHVYVREHARQGRTLDYSPIEWTFKPAMLVSSVQAVVACYATAPRVCTLVLFITKWFDDYMYMNIKLFCFLQCVSVN